MAARKVKAVIVPHLAFAGWQRELDMSDGVLAEFLCVDARNIRRWKRGQLDVPRWIEKFLPVFVRLDADDVTLDELRKMAGLDE